MVYKTIAVVQNVLEARYVYVNPIRNVDRLMLFVPVLIILKVEWPEVLLRIKLVASVLKNTNVIQRM